MQDRAPDVGIGTPSPELSTLSPREREVLDAAREGLSARAIARRLSLTEATVRSHLSAIYSKVGVAGRVELLARFNGKASPTLSSDTEIRDSRPEPRQGWGKARIVALVTVLAVGFVATALLAVQLSSPPRSDLGTVSQLIASNSVARVDLSGSTLTITDKDGGSLQVEGVTVEDFQPIQMAAIHAGIPVSASSGSQTALVTVAMLGTYMIPVFLLLAVVLLLARLTRRPPPLRSAG